MCALQPWYIIDGVLIIKGYGSGQIYKNVHLLGSWLLQSLQAFCLHSRNFLLNKASLSKSYVWPSCVMHAICIFALLPPLIRFLLHQSRLLQTSYKQGAKTYVSTTSRFQKAQTLFFLVNSLKMQLQQEKLEKEKNGKLPTISSLMKLLVSAVYWADHDMWSQTC